MITSPRPVFVLGTGRCGSTLVHEVLARHLGGVPLVLLERGPHQTRFAAVGIDAAAGLEQGIAHLVRAGHRRIGMLDGDGPETAGPRREAFLAEARRHGLPVDGGWTAG